MCRRGRAFSRALIFTFSLAACFVATNLATFAAITGQVEGTVTGADGKPLGDVRVSLVSQSGTYRAVTDGSGHYAVIGIVPDTYTLAFEKTGLEPQVVTGVTITPDTTQTINGSLREKRLRVIATVKGRRSSDAFQVNQTEDSYAYNGAQLQTLLGKDFNTDQKSLLTSLPSVTVDTKGGIFIRGGFAYEVAYQYEGIDYTEPTRSLQDQFSNIGNFDQLSGVGSVQIIPGGGDASHGNTGTGLVSFQAKRGTSPGQGKLDAEVGNFPFYHQAGFEYGYATPNGRLSNYLTYTGTREDFQYGPQGAHAGNLGYNFGFDPRTVAGYSLNPYQTILDSSQSIYDSPSHESVDTLLDNFIYKFGKRNEQSLQFFIQNQVVGQQLNYGGFANNLYFSGTPGAQVLFNQFAPPGFPQPGAPQGYDLFGAVVPFYPTQTAVTQLVGGPDKITSPFEAYKLEYTNALNASTYVTTRFYRTFNASSEDQPSLGVRIPDSGGLRTAIALEASKQSGSKNFIEVGGKYEFVRPFGTRNYYGAFEQLGRPAYLGLYPLAPDFIPVGAFTTPTADMPAMPVAPGYLAKFFPLGRPPRLPYASVTATTDQQAYGLFAQDTVTFSDRLRATLGVRLDGYNFLTPDSPENPPATSGLRHQRLYEPHVGLAQKLGRHDALRFTYGRTLSIPLPSLVSFQLDRTPYAAFVGIPTNGVVDGCGTNGKTRCKDYADELYWLERDFLYPTGSTAFTTPLKGASYTNYDLSYSHDFGHDIGVKVTPFFRRGYDIVEESQNVVGYNGNFPILGTPGYTNQGLQKATGVEFLATKDATYGISGSLSATYLNQIGNDVPGTSLTETSLALGNLYHSPNFAPLQATLAVTYRSRGGIRINPVVHVESGYPYGLGAYSTGVIGGKNYNLPSTDTFFGPANAYYFTDPQNPGTYLDPVIAATRGTREGSSAGSLTSSPRLNTDLTLEFSAPGRSSTFGVTVTNLFDQVYGIPIPNPLYRNVIATGATGVGNNGQFYSIDPQYPGVYFPVATGGPAFTGADLQAPYIVLPTHAPRSLRFYYQLGL